MKLFSLKNRTLLSDLRNISIVLVLVVFVAFLFPYQGGMHYEYDEGKPWPYQNLVATTSFGLEKTDAQLEQERQQIKEQFLPIFEKDSIVPAQSKAKFTGQFDTLLNQIALEDPSMDLVQRELQYRSKGSQLLESVYDKGVINVNDYDLSSTESVQIIDGEVKRVRQLDRLLSQQQARSHLQEQLRKSALPDADLIFPLLTEALSPNLVYDSLKSERYLQMELEQISPTEGLVSEGEVIVESGQIVTPEIDRKIRSYEAQYHPSLGSRLGSWWVFIGYALLTVYLIGLFLVFLKSNAREVYDHFNQLLFMIVWIGLYSYLVSVIDPIDNISTYIIPFCIVPIVIKNFFNDRLALFVHLVIILMASFLTNLGYEFMFTEIVAGIATVLSFRIQTVWNRLFTTVGVIFLSYVVTYTGLALIREGNIADVSTSYYLWFFISAFLTFLAYPLLPLIERTFRFTSDITLGELADMNHPLLKKLSVEAPGTLQHSLQVSNLAEAAADKIGANALLVKVAALYHDIGKMKNPRFFIENQSGDNPHKKLNPEESAEIIIGHVTYGLELAKKNRLPRLLESFILSHHGTTRVEYFFRKYNQQQEEEIADDSDFRYPGPRPTTKEEAILMLADSLEASCKSLDNPNDEALKKMIDKIIKGKIEGGQLANSDLSFRELQICRKVFTKLLKSIHHVRVAYPNEPQNEGEEE